MFYSLSEKTNTIKTTTYDVGNHGSGFGKAQQCGGVVIGSPTTIPL
jgi:hypothetical protein